MMDLPFGIIRCGVQALEVAVILVFTRRCFRCRARERPCHEGVAKRAVVCSISDRVMKLKFLLF